MTLLLLSSPAFLLMGLLSWSPSQLFSALLSPLFLQRPFSPLDLSTKELSILLIPVQILPSPRNLPRAPKRTQGPFLCSPLALWNYGVIEELAFRNAGFESQLCHLPFVILDKTLNLTFWAYAFIWNMEKITPPLHMSETCCDPWRRWRTQALK